MQRPLYARFICLFCLTILQTFSNLLCKTLLIGLMFADMAGLPGNKLTQVWHFAYLDYGRGVMECY